LVGIQYQTATAAQPKTVTFDANGGTGTMAAQTTNKPEALNLNTFTKVGYTFANWNTAANGSGTTYADGATYSFTADLTLYAQWNAIPISHTVTFGANGGTGTMAPQSSSISASLSLNTFTRTGYNFTGWNTTTDGSGTPFSDGTTYSFASDLSLFAQWSAIPTYAVTFDANGGVGIMSSQVDSGPANLNVNTFTRVGYTFNDWNTAADGTGKAYADGANYPFNANVTLYAQWNAMPTHTVTFNSNGGSGSMSNQISSVSASLTLNTFTRSGYTFTGWNTAADGSGTAYADGASYSFSADLTLYAQWTSLPTFSVTFDANGGLGTMAPQVDFGPANLNANAFTRAGYTFIDWNVSADGSGKSYADGANYPFNANVTLYAQWSAVSSGTPVDIAAIAGLSNPVTGFIIYPSVNETAQYTGTVSWSTNPLVFAPLTIYTATITLTPKAGYTLLGVPANFFTVVGAASTTNSADSGVVTATFVSTGPVISTSSIINVGAVNPTVVLKGSGFKTGDLSADMTVVIDGSGLTVGSITGDSANQVTINFVGTATTGFVTIQAKTTAFLPVTESPSNQIFLIFATSSAGAGSSVPVTIPLGGSNIDVVITLPAALKDGQTVKLSVVASNESAANYPLLTVDITSNFYNFDKPLVIEMPDITSYATLAHSLLGGGYQLIPQIFAVPGENFCADQENDGYIDNGSTITIYTCHISAFGYREDQSAVSLTSDKSSLTVGTTAQLTAGGGSGTVAYTYSSANTNICSVNSSGLVTAISVGTCSLTVTNPENGAYINKSSSVVTITVTAAPSSGGGGGGGGSSGGGSVSSGGAGGSASTNLSQPSVLIAPAQTLIQLTKTTQLTVTGGAGSGAVTYQSITPEICSVTNDGVVTGLKAGECKVRVTKAASGTYLEANSPYITITISDSEKKAADELAAKAAAEAAAAAKALADAAAAAAKAEADRLALIEAQAAEAKAAALAKAEAARMALLNRNQITWKKSGKIYRVKINMAPKYAWELITIRVGVKLKGKVVYKTTDWLALDGRGDGFITQSKKPLKGNYYRIVLNKKAVYTQLIK